MASTLPPNILSYIGTHVSKDDRPHCALVCKHWKEPFLDAYWGSLKIGKDGMDINTFVYNKSLLINAHRVWAVVFDRVWLKDNESLLELQRSLPEIRYLEFYDYIPCVSFISDGLDWSLWQSLTYLKISLDFKSKTTSFQSLLRNLSVLPCLVHLGLYQSYYHAKQYTLSWNDSESLHKHLPRLDYLEHNFHFKPITTDEIESIKAVEPAQTMTRIKFNDSIGTYWLFYFASKYPSLRHFTSQEFPEPSKRHPIDYSPQKYQADLQLLSTLDQFFPCLKMAVTTLRSENMYLLFIFFETLRHFGTKIEHVDLNSHDDRDMDVDCVNRCIQPISESLKFLKIDFGDYSKTILFAVCPRLVTLCIKGNYWSRIDADTTLECFPALRSLYVSSITFYLSTNPHTYTPHPLQKLTIKNSHVTNAALHYLSIHCSQLKHVSLIDVYYGQFFYKNYNDEDNYETVKMIFDMTMTNLDTFVFTFTDGLINNPRSFPKHYMIEQMENDNDILQTTQQPSRINWYHVYCARTNRKKKVLKWELGKRDIEFCQRYLEDFDRRRKRGKWRRDIKKDYYGFVQRRFWKKDLKHGVLIFRFKSVKSHIIRIKILHDDSME
ncbi:hypothetical protein CLU79DRAFT_314177 [Phycomyces nitens]|nr:hypothetical protein CLU79DRAFT_314177 [Phycomyces nitens]